jgi:hypothetical protein
MVCNGRCITQQIVLIELQSGSLEQEQEYNMVLFYLIDIEYYILRVLYYLETKLGTYHQPLREIT